MIKTGYHKKRSSKRSNAEVDVERHLQETGVTFYYEQYRIPYTQNHTYTPDFVLDNGIILEVKGGSDSFVKRIHGKLQRLPSFDAASRGKMLRVKKQYPHLDIRFIFMSDGKLSTGKKCSDWCKKNGFKYHIGADVPIAWLEERGIISQDLIKKG